MAQVLVDARTLRICLNCQGDVLPVGLVPQFLPSSVCRCPAAPMVERMMVAMVFEFARLGSPLDPSKIFEVWGPMPEGFSWTHGDDAA